MCVSSLLVSERGGVLFAGFYPEWHFSLTTTFIYSPRDEIANCMQNQAILLNPEASIIRPSLHEVTGEETCLGGSSPPLHFLGNVHKIVVWKSCMCFSDAGVSGGSGAVNHQQDAMFFYCLELSSSDLCEHPGLNLHFTSVSDATNPSWRAAVLYSSYSAAVSTKNKSYFLSVCSYARFPFSLASRQ